MTFTKIIFFTLLYCAFTPLIMAKRIAPQAVAPVTQAGIEYSAPLGVAKIGIVQARDAANKKLLWEQRIYKLNYDPELERDVQWIFISNLKIKDESLIVTNEQGRVFSMNLKTRKVNQLGDEKADNNAAKGLRLILELDSKQVKSEKGFKGTLRLVNDGSKPVVVFDYADLRLNLLHKDGTPVQKTTNQGFGKVDLESLKKRLITCPKNKSIQLERFDPYIDKPNNNLVYTRGRGHIGWKFARGEYRLSVTLIENGALPQQLGIKNVWTGSLTSNEVVFTVTE